MTNRFPPWLKQKIYAGGESQRVRRILRKSGLNTICENARCPNLGECFSRGTATFLILGDVCTRNCRFCAVKSGTPAPPDEEEPLRLSRAVEQLGLKYVVVTSVTRDDLADGGAGHFSRVVRVLKSGNPRIKVEVLVPDFKGEAPAVARVTESEPDVFAHNLETVARLYPAVRPGADYGRSLEVLKLARSNLRRGLSKSGLMLGLGETSREVEEVLRDLRKVRCEVVTLGQYLRPAAGKFPVAEFILPERFRYYEGRARSLGFRCVASGPLVRSSYHAEGIFLDYKSQALNEPETGG